MLTVRSRDKFRSTSRLQQRFITACQGAFGRQPPGARRGQRLPEGTAQGAGSRWWVPGGPGPVLGLPTRQRPRRGGREAGQGGPTLLLEGQPRHLCCQGAFGRQPPGARRGQRLPEGTAQGAGSRWWVPVGPGPVLGLPTRARGRDSVTGRQRGHSFGAMQWPVSSPAMRVSTSPLGPCGLRARRNP